MIHYPISVEALVDAINTALGSQSRQDDWWFRAHADFLRAIKDRRFISAQAYWGEVKGAFMALQENKCAYCEQPMPQGSKSSIAYDVEHYRPKSSTKAWPDAKTRQRLAIGYDVGQGRARGYPELAHHPCNYAVACKVCNSPYKSDCFPILGKADEDEFDVAALKAAERPALPLPLGTWGEDPGSFLTFEGFIALPASPDPALRRRAEIVIDFFELNRRADLLLGRATAITLLYQQLKEVQKPELAADAVEAQAWVDACLVDGAPFSGAARAFHRTYKADPSKAVDIVRLANRYLARKSSTVAKSLANILPGQVTSMDEVMSRLD